MMNFRFFCGWYLTCKWFDFHDRFSTKNGIFLLNLIWFIWRYCSLAPNRKPTLSSLLYLSTTGRAITKIISINLLSFAFLTIIWSWALLLIFLPEEFSTSRFIFWMGSFEVYFASVNEHECSFSFLICHTAIWRFSSKSSDSSGSLEVLSNFFRWLLKPWRLPFNVKEPESSLWVDKYESEPYSFLLI